MGAELPDGQEQAPQERPPVEPAQTAQNHAQPRPGIHGTENFTVPPAAVAHERRIDPPHRIPRQGRRNPMPQFPAETLRLVSLPLQQLPHPSPSHRNPGRGPIALVERHRQFPVRPTPALVQRQHCRGDPIRLPSREGARVNRWRSADPAAPKALPPGPQRAGKAKAPEQEPQQKNNEDRGGKRDEKPHDECAK